MSASPVIARLRAARLSVAALAVALTLTSTAAAYRVLEQREDAYEFRLAEITLPEIESGLVTFRSCDACALTSLRLSPQTVLRIDGTTFDFARFREAVDEIGAIENGPDDTHVAIFYDIATGRLTRIEIFRF